MEDTDKDWQHWGEADPYYAVLTDARFRHGKLSAHLDEFFRLGEEETERYVSLARRHYPDMRMGRAIDFGCGVGRLALPLARRFEEVVGIDISPAMLKEAAANAASQGIENARFVTSDDRLSQVSGQFDYISSKIVLQHIPVERGLKIIARMLELLAPGGVASLHFTVDRQEGRLRRGLYWLQRRVPAVNAAANLARGRGAGEPIMQINEYPLLTVLEMFRDAGVNFPMIELEQNVAWQSVHLIGRKAL